MSGQREGKKKVNNDIDGKETRYDFRMQAKGDGKCQNKRRSQERTNIHKKKDRACR